jgi:hypothetical protein
MYPCFLFFSSSFFVLGSSSRRRVGWDACESVDAWQRGRQARYCAFGWRCQRHLPWLAKATVLWARGEAEESADVRRQQEWGWSVSGSGSVVSSLNSMISTVLGLMKNDRVGHYFHSWLIKVNVKVCIVLCVKKERISNLLMCPAKIGWTQRHYI